MKVAYAFRRAMYYPYAGPPFIFPARDVRAGWLRAIADLDFDGLEVGLDAVGPEFSEQRAQELRR